jgi:hypothetical protein
MLARGRVCVSLWLLSVCFLLAHQTAAQVVIGCPSDAENCVMTTHPVANGATCKCCSGQETYEKYKYFVAGLSIWVWDCKSCPPGKYQESPSTGKCYDYVHCGAGKTGPGFSDCTACAKGKFKAWEGSHDCSKTPQNTYQDEEGQAGWKNCPQFSTSPEGSTAITNCLCNPGYTGSGTCTACVAGKYKASAGSAACDDCVPGKSSLAATTSSSECFDIQANCLATACAFPHGTNLDWQEGPCHCCAGQEHEKESYRVSSTRSRCFACDTGFYMDQIKHTTKCKMCADGKQSSEGITYLLGWSPYIGATACIDCVPGKYNRRSAASVTQMYMSNSVDKIHTCEPCLPGSYATTSGQTVCQNCTAGTYSEAGASVCTDCPAGQYTNSELGFTSCVNCSAGEYKTMPGAGVCNKCSRGSYSAEAGAAACDQCPSGKYSSARYYVKKAVTDLQITFSELLCWPQYAGTYRFDYIDSRGNPVFKFPVSGANYYLFKTFAAGKGWWKLYFQVQETLYIAYAQDDSYTPSLTFHEARWNGTWVEICHVNNNFSPTISLLSLKSNEYVEEGSTSCSNCAAGEYKTMPGAGVCKKCSIGSYSAESGAATCDQCQSGKYSAETGLTVCTECVAGKYATSDRARCEDCPSNSTSPAGSDADNCTCNVGYEPVLPTGSVTVSMPLKCSACAAGKFKSRRSIAPAVAHVNYIDFEKCQACAEGLYAAHRDDPDDPYEALRSE